MAFAHAKVWVGYRCEKCEKKANSMSKDYKIAYHKRLKRFCVVSPSGSTILDDHNGCGYKTVQAAHKAYSWKKKQTLDTEEKFSELNKETLNKIYYKLLSKYKDSSDINILDEIFQELEQHTIVELHCEKPKTNKEKQNKNKNDNQKEPMEILPCMFCKKCSECKLKIRDTKDCFELNNIYH